MSDDTTTDAGFDYKATQECLMLVASLAETLNLDRLLEEASRAETRAPFLDPTLYIRGGRQLQLMMELARAAKPLAAAWKKFCAEYPEAEDVRIRGDLMRGMPLREAMRGGREAGAPTLEPRRTP